MVITSPFVKLLLIQYWARGLSFSRTCLQQRKVSSWLNSLFDAGKQMLSPSAADGEEDGRSKRRIADTGNRKLSAGTASRVLYNSGSHLTATAAHAQII